MAYSRFWDSDIYIYPHVDGYIECCGCLLDPSPESGLFGLSKKIKNDSDLALHLAEHEAAGHKMPKDLYKRITADRHRYIKL